MEVAAHRGNVEGFPENTMPAFESAYSLGVDMIELDLRMTREKNSHSRAHPKQSRFLRNTDSPTACT